MKIVIESQGFSASEELAKRIALEVKSALRRHRSGVESLPSKRSRNVVATQIGDSRMRLHERGATGMSPSFNREAHPQARGARRERS